MFPASRFGSLRFSTVKAVVQPVTPLFVVYSIWARNSLDQLAVFGVRGWRASYSLHARGRVEPGEVVELLCPPV